MNGIIKSSDYPEVEGAIGKKYHIDSPNTEKDDVNGNAAWNWLKKPYFKKEKWIEPKHDVDVDDDDNTSLLFSEQDTLKYIGVEPIKIDIDWDLLSDDK
jgi:hypothetical protein